MKRITGLLILMSAVTFAHAQSTMPAMGANTPKGEVAKTDASVNQSSATERNNTKSANASSKQTRKTKTTKSKSATTSPM